jgi:hypothetical protein
MIFWDLSIHIIDKFKKGKKFIESKSIFSYYYPHFWGKPPQVNREIGQVRYDNFWITYWSVALVLLIIYIFFR